MSLSQSSPAPEPENAGLLPTTRWSRILRIQQTLDSDSEDKAREELNSLCGEYVVPIRICAAFWYRKYRGYSGELAEQKAPDAVQNLFLKLLRRDFVRKLDPAEGKFRLFILKALWNSLYDEFDQENARKRYPGQSILSLQEETEDGEL